MREYIRKAYQRGKASLQAGTVTPEACQTAITSLQGQVTDLQRDLAAAQAADLSPDQEDQVDQAFAQARKVFEVMGTCERVLPPEVSQGMRTAFADQTDPEKQAAAQLFMTAYETGKASPRAASITLDQCIEEIGAVQARMQSLTADMGAYAPAD